MVFLKPKIPQKVKRVVRGWTQPSRQNARELAERIETKVGRKMRKGVYGRQSDILTAEMRERLYRNANQSVGEASLERKQIQARIAAKYALDAVGVSNSAKRNSVQETMSKIAFLQRKELSEGKTTSTVNQKQRLLKQLQKQLGEARSLVFLKRFAQVGKKLRDEFKF